MCMQPLPVVCGDSTAPLLGLLPFVINSTAFPLGLLLPDSHCSRGKAFGALYLTSALGGMLGQLCAPWYRSSGLRLLCVLSALAPPPFFLEATLGQPATACCRSAVCNQHGAHAPVGRAGLARGLHCRCGCQDAGLSLAELPALLMSQHCLHLSCLSNVLAFVSSAHGSTEADRTELWPATPLRSGLHQPAHRPAQLAVCGGPALQAGRAAVQASTGPTSGPAWLAWEPWLASCMLLVQPRL